MTDLPPEPDFVILGATRFHGVDWEATAFLRLHWLAFTAVRDLYLAEKFDAYRKIEHKLHSEAVAADMDYWAIPGAWRLGQVDDWSPEIAVPLCEMIPMKRPVTIGQARATGMTWSKECAKKLGLIADDRVPLARVGWTQSRRAYMHAIDCDDCLHHGISACTIFSRLALGEIDSDVDPRLDPDCEAVA